MKKVSLVLVLNLLSLLVSVSYGQAVLGDVALQKNLNLPGQIPRNTIKAPEVLISRAEYVISYNRIHREMNWAAWLITKNSMGKSGRSGNFDTDPDLERYLMNYSEHAVGPKDYRNTCFDRGHQVASGDRTASPETNTRVFYMSNMIPQTAFINKGPWEKFESYIRAKVTNESKKAYVISGPIFDMDFGTTGVNNDITVPSKNFKIVLFLNSNQTAAHINERTESIAVIMPNILSSGKNPQDDREELCREATKGPSKSVDWKKFRTTISEVERLSGFKFFSF